MRTRIVLVVGLSLALISTTLASTSPITDRGQTDLSAIKKYESVNKALSIAITAPVVGDFIEVYSFTGKKVFEATADSANVTIPTASLYRGVYVYAVKSRDGTYLRTGKWFKESPSQRSGQITKQTLDPTRETIMVHNPKPKVKFVNKRTTKVISYTPVSTKNKSKSKSKACSNKGEPWIDPSNEGEWVDPGIVC